MKFARSLLSILALASLCSFAWAAEDTAAVLKEPARDVWQGWLWIPLDEAFDSSGTLIAGRIPEHASRSLSGNVYDGNSAYRRAALDAVNSERDCPVISMVFDERLAPKPNSTLPELTHGANEIFQGAIVAQHPGLLIGRAGTLLEIAVERVLKGRELDRIYIFYPRLRAKVGTTVICQQDAAFRLVPRTGDRVVFFVLEKPLNRAGTLFVPEPTEIIFADSVGELRAPARPSQYPPTLTSLDQLDAAIESFQRDLPRAPDRPDWER